MGVCVVSVTLGVALATLRFRQHGDRLGMDAAMTLVLLGVGPLFVIGVVYVVDLLSLAGP